MKIFVVTALHNTGHGEVASTIMLSSDLVTAVDMVRNVEKCGYQFYGNGTYVAIDHMNFPGFYDKNEHNVVFIRRKMSGTWKEEWLSEAYEKQFTKEHSA